jgi:hypothetical protein
MNKALWQEAFMTDPKAVKPITGKTYSGNSPKPYWLIERATDMFGPIGIGWGVNVKSERFERMGEHDVLHVAVVSVWYVWNGQRSETFDQMGGTKAAYKTSKGALLVDEDAGKKSVTDGMVKCLSMIGFAGDIFSGRWDDSKYVAEANHEYRAKEEAEHQAQAAAQRSEWLEATAMKLEACESLDELQQCWKVAYALMKSQGDKEAIATLEPIKDRMKALIAEATA